MPNREGEAREGLVGAASGLATTGGQVEGGAARAAGPPEDAPTRIRSLAELGLPMGDSPTDSAEPGTMARSPAAPRATDVAPRTELDAGDFVAGIRLAEPLATGQRVSCWRGHQADRTPATVHLLYAGASDRESQTFARGASRMGAIAREHPMRGVARVLRVVPGKNAYVTDMAAAGTMDDLPMLNWALPDKVSFLRRVCAALGAVHASGHTHGCLRPANVLLDDELQPIVSDVGVVQLADSFPGKASSDNDYAPYAAPEVRKGAPTSIRSDIYSAGRLLYYLLLGAHPTDADEAVPVLAALSANAPDGLVRIVRRATALDPTMRYSGVEELLGDIAKYQSAGLVGLPAPELPTGSAPAAAAAAAPRPSVPRDAGDVVRAPAAERNRVEAQRRLAAAQARAPQSRAVQAQPPAPSATTQATLPEAPDQDIASFRQRLVLVALAAGVLAAGLATTFVSGVESIVGASAVIVGAVGLSALVPAMPRLPRASRALWALLVLGSVVWFDPGIYAARAGRAWLLGPSRPATRVAALRALRAKGLVEFVDLDLVGADLSGLDLSFLVFDRTRMARAKLTGTRLAGASLIDVDLSGADLSGADLQGVDVTRTLGWDETICSAETRLPAGWRCGDGRPMPRGGVEVRRDLERP